MSKITEITTDRITFDDGAYLEHSHDQDCCESHYLDFASLNMDDVQGLEFNLLTDGSFFERVKGYGIRLLPTNGHPISIAGYGYNNGYYSNDITLTLRMSDGSSHEFDVTECQEEEG